MRNTCLSQSFDVLGGHRVSQVSYLRRRTALKLLLRDFLCGVILANRVMYH